MKLLIDIPEKEYNRRRKQTQKHLNTKKIVETTLDISTDFRLDWWNSKWGE